MGNRFMSIPTKKVYSSYKIHTSKHLNITTQRLVPQSWRAAPYQLLYIS